MGVGLLDRVCVCVFVMARYGCAVVGLRQQGETDC